MMGRYGHMGLLRIASAADHLAVDEALDRVGMTTFRHRQIGELSGGQRKRVFIAVHSLSRVRSSSWMSLLPRSMCKPRIPSSPFCAHFVMRGG